MEKDAWDIYFTMTNYPGGIDALVAETQPNMQQGFVREGLRKTGNKFASLGHVGQQFVADFEEADVPDERARIKRDAYERVNYFLRQLGDERWLWGEP